MHDTATDVDSAQEDRQDQGGRTYAYDRLVLSPGIDIKYNSIPGYSREASPVMPHAYTHGAHGKRLLEAAAATR